jgi:hypothetical protein
MYIFFLSFFFPARAGISRAYSYRRRTPESTRRTHPLIVWHYTDYMGSCQAKSAYWAIFSFSHAIIAH